jgi:CDP-diacylglycerol--glycerol-3-phosphate 3-phosphatidyltransferase
MSAANKITLVRIVLLPLLLLFLARDTAVARWSALAVFLLASATDWLDGYVARTRSEVTVLGKLLDPVADKLLVTAVLLPLVHKELIPAWMGVLLLGREFLVSGLRSVASAEGVVIAAGAAGKWKMGLFIAALSFLIVSPVPPASGAPWRLPGTLLLWGALVLSVGSAAQYFYAYRHAFRSRSQAAPGS